MWFTLEGVGPSIATLKEGLVGSFGEWIQLLIHDSCLSWLQRALYVFTKIAGVDGALVD